MQFHRVFCLREERLCKAKKSCCKAKEHVVKAGKKLRAEINVISLSARHHELLCCFCAFRRRLEGNSTNSEKFPV